MSTQVSDQVSSQILIPVGTVVAYGLDPSLIPDGWLPCDGRAIPIEYKDLYDKCKNHCTPNLCGRTLIGTGWPANEAQTDNRHPDFPPEVHWNFSDTGGEYQHKLDANELPSHSHTINKGDFGIHRRSFKGNDDNDLPFETNASSKLEGTDSTGGNSAHFNMQPYFAITYIIYSGAKR